MYSPGPQRGPATRQELWFYAIFCFALLALFAGDVWTNYSPAKLSALLFVLFWIPLLALHEAAHAAVAKIVGWRVDKIVIGMGRPIGAFQIGSVDVELKVLPLEGFIRSFPKDLNFPGLKHAMIYAAGPGVELLLAGLILQFGGPEKLLVHSDQYATIALQSLALASATGGILNLIPHAVQTSDGNIIPNDGLGILRSLSRPSGAYVALVNQERSGDNEDDV